MVGDAVVVPGVALDHFAAPRAPSRRPKRVALAHRPDVQSAAMLVYVDESYKPPGTTNCKSTFAAVSMREDRYRAFDVEFFRLKRYFFKITEPFQLELKGRLLLSGDKIGLPRNREFIRQLMALMREFGVVPFAVVQPGSFQLSALKPDLLPTLYRGVLRRVDRYMQERFPKYHGILFFDGIDHGTNQKRVFSRICG